MKQGFYVKRARIKPEVRQQIQQIHKERPALSWQAIADMTGVSTNSVGRILKEPPPTLRNHRNEVAVVEYYFSESGGQCKQATARYFNTTPYQIVRCLLNCGEFEAVWPYVLKQERPDVYERLYGHNGRPDKAPEILAGDMARSADLDAGGLLDRILARLKRYEDLKGEYSRLQAAYSEQGEKLETLQRNYNSLYDHAQQYAARIAELQALLARPD